MRKHKQQQTPLIITIRLLGKLISRLRELHSRLLIIQGKRNK